jgi:hypothetical protein
MRIYPRTTQAIGLVAALAILSWASSSGAQTGGCKADATHYNNALRHAGTRSPFDSGQ